MTYWESYIIRTLPIALLTLLYAVTSYELTMVIGLAMLIGSLNVVDL